MLRFCQRKALYLCKHTDTRVPIRSVFDPLLSSSSMPSLGISSSHFPPSSTYGGGSRGMDIPPSETSSIQISYFFRVQIFEREYGEWTRLVDSFQSKDYASKDESNMLAQAVINEFLDKYPCTTTTKLTFHARMRRATPWAKEWFVPI